MSPYFSNHFGTFDTRDDPTLATALGALRHVHAEGSGFTDSQSLNAGVRLGLRRSCPLDVSPHEEVGVTTLNKSVIRAWKLNQTLHNDSAGIADGRKPSTIVDTDRVEAEIRPRKNTLNA